MGVYWIWQTLDTPTIFFPSKNNIPPNAKKCL
jgi:hypothetical protein